MWSKAKDNGKKSCGNMMSYPNVPGSFECQFQTIEDTREEEPKGCSNVLEKSRWLFKTSSSSR